MRQAFEGCLQIEESNYERQKNKEDFATNEMIVVYIILALCILIGIVNPAFCKCIPWFRFCVPCCGQQFFAAFEMMVIISGGVMFLFLPLPILQCATAMMIMNGAEARRYAMLAFSHSDCDRNAVWFSQLSTCSPSGNSPLIATLG